MFGAGENQFIDFMLSFSIGDSEDYCMKIVIESFLYNEEQILKESCKNWDFNIKSYTPKGGEVEANLQLESYCPNSQETLNLQFNQGEVFKVEMLKTIVFRFENPG